MLCSRSAEHDFKFANSKGHLFTKTQNAEDIKPQTWIRLKNAFNKTIYACSTSHKIAKSEGLFLIFVHTKLYSELGEAKVVQVKSFSLKFKSKKVNTLLMIRNMSQMVAGPPQKSATPLVVLAVNCFVRLPRQQKSIREEFLSQCFSVSVSANLLMEVKTRL